MFKAKQKKTIPFIEQKIKYNESIIFNHLQRVGRTGRAGKTGTSISFFTRSDWGSAEELIKILEEANQGVPDELRDMKKRFDHMKEKRDRERANGGGGGGGR